MNDFDDIDQGIADELRSGFAGAAYTRPASTLRRPSRAPMLIGATATVALVVTAVAITSDGSRSPALAWSPTPKQADPSVTEQALRKCSLPAAPEAGSGPVLAPPPGSGEVGAVQSGTVVVGSGSAEGGAQPAAGVDGGPNLVVSASGDLPAMKLPTELPPLVAVDVRGTGALATFADDQWVAQCMLLPGDGGFDLGIVSLTSADGSAGAVSVGVGAGSAVGGTVSAGSAAAGTGSTGYADFLSVGMTQLPDGSKVSTALGSVPDGTVRVVADVPGVDPAEATITGSWFSLWWEGGSGEGAVHGYDASGAELWSRPLPSTDLPPGMPMPVSPAPGG